MPAGMRENISKKILKLSELEIEDFELLQNLISDEDKRLYEMISAALERSGALSVRGVELPLDRRQRTRRPLKVCRCSSALWQRLRLRFSMVGTVIRNFFSALHIIDTGSLAE